MPDFFKILAISTIFTLLQALCSALVSSVFGVLLGFVSLFGLRTAGATRVAKFFGYFLFSLPGATIAFLFLNSWSSFGLSAILMCQVLMTALWVFSESRIRLRGYLQGGDHAAVLASLVFGARLLNSIRRGPISEFLREEVRYYFLYLFFIFFNSFSLVLILGGSPRYSTLDVLGFFELTSGFSPYRFYFILLWQMLVVILVSGVLIKKFPIKRNEFPIGSSTLNMNLWFGRQGQIGDTLGLVFRIGVVFFWSFAVYKTLRSTFVFSESWTEILDAAAVTLRVMISAVGFFFLNFVFAYFWKHKANEFLKYILMGFSPLLMGAALIPLLENVPDFEFFKIGLCMWMGFLPWFLFVWDSAINRIPNDQILSAQVFGAKPRNLFWRLKIPYAKGSLLILFIGLLVTATSELFFSSYFLVETESLAMLGRRWAQRYNFSGMGVILFFQLMICFSMFLGIHFFVPKEDSNARF
jgi:ABC-type Fe3+ transport system permease subunit